VRVEFTRRALIQIGIIVEYIREHNPRAAARVADAVEAAAQMLGEHPNSGRRQDVAGVRKAVVPGYGYLLFYTVDAEAGAVRIFGVVHPAMERPYNDA